MAGWNAPSQVTVHQWRQPVTGPCRTSAPKRGAGGHTLGRSAGRSACLIAVESCGYCVTNLADPFLGLTVNSPRVVVPGPPAPGPEVVHRTTKHRVVAGGFEHQHLSTYRVTWRGVLVFNPQCDNRVRARGAARRRRSMVVARGTEHDQKPVSDPPSCICQSSVIAVKSSLCAHPCVCH